MVPFSRMLEEALRRQSLTQSAFARQVGVPRSVVSEVLRGRRKPPKIQAVKWMTALDIPAGERLGWRRAIVLACADPLLAEWILELETEVDRLRQNGEGGKRPGKGSKP